MKVLFLTDNFPPESNAPASRTFEHARQWVADGHDVTIITCAPNFPTGKLFVGYKNDWYRVEQMSGIRVVRVKTYITANEGFIKRTLDYLSFMFMAILAAFFQVRADVVVATSPQFFTAVAGYFVGLFRRVPFVFELRDMWPASITAVEAMKPSPIIRLLEKLEMFLYRKATTIVCVTKTFKRELVERGIEEDKLVVVHNGVDLARYRPTAPSHSLLTEINAHGAFIVGYIGTHGMAHGLEKIVEAAALLQSQKDIVFLFAGGGAQRAALESDIAARGLQNVRLLPMQPKSRMPEVWSVCDIALIPLRDKPLFASVIPSKLFECMGMGIPVIMSVPQGEATSIVERTCCGVVLPPEDPAALARTIVSLKNDEAQMQRLRLNALDAAENYSRTQQARKMLDELVQAARQ